MYEREMGVWGRGEEGLLVPQVPLFLLQGRLKTRPAGRTKEDKRMKKKKKTGRMKRG